MERNRIFFLVFACITPLAFLLAASSSDGIASLLIKGLALGFASLASIYAGTKLVSYEAPPSKVQKKELLIDVTALEDSRLIELARSGLLDCQLVASVALVKELQKNCESSDELIRFRAKKCQEHLKRLESMPNLGLAIKEPVAGAYLLTAQDPSQINGEEATQTVISLDTIASALKPGVQRGEVLSIKIQRLGKEPKQGVGYLEDGTMVVVNGGGDFLSQTVRTQVLSQKYSSSGKIIFCNALGVDELGDQPRHDGEVVSPYHLSYQ